MALSQLNARSDQDKYLMLGMFGAGLIGLLLFLSIQLASVLGALRITPEAVEREPID